MITNRNLKRFAEDKYLSALDFTDNIRIEDYPQKCCNCKNEISDGVEFCEILVWDYRDEDIYDIALCLDCKKKIENGD